ncbi:APC amino acid permease [Flagelloscypha sp. PMI_526]|nr:APC amino acid permease [Flagelloscypha sp. PMI_526]
MSVFLQEKPKGNSDKASYYSLRSEFSGHGGNSIGLYDPSQESKWTRLGLSWESFKRAPGTTGGLAVSGQDNLDDLEKLMMDAPMLQQKIKPRHLTMIAVAGSVGTGLFVGTGSALAAGGPIGLLIAYLLVGVLLINVTQAIGEMSIMYPVSGGFYTLAGRFLDQSGAFAMGWNYAWAWAITLPLEIYVAGSLMSYWPTAIPTGVWITLFWLVIVIITVFGTLGFAEEEFWSSCLKLLVITIFIVVGIVCIAGAGPPQDVFSTPIGNQNWQKAGFLPNGFSGFCAVFVTAAFSFGGTELIGLAAAETPNPRQTMPGAVKGTFWRVILVYVATVVIIGTLLPYNDPRLRLSDPTAASPFILILEDAKIPGLTDLVVVTIIVSVVSIGVSSVYAGSRTITALAEQGYAPKFFAYVDKSSRPLFSVLLILGFAPLAYIGLAAAGEQIFQWMLALSGLGTLATWLSICFCHIRFRQAWRAQGHSVEELPFRALGGTIGSWIGVVIIILVFIGQFYFALFPRGTLLADPLKAVENFFSAFLAIPIMIIFAVVGYLWKRTVPKKVHEIDLDGGRKCWLTAEQMREYRAERRRAPIHIRAYRLLFSN